MHCSINWICARFFAMQEGRLTVFGVRSIAWISFVIGGCCYGDSFVSVDGVVIDEVGRPIAGARVSLYVEGRVESSSIVRAVSRSDGSFRVASAFPPCSTSEDHLLEAIHPDFQYFEKHIDRNAGLVTFNIVLNKVADTAGGHAQVP